MSRRIIGPAAWIGLAAGLAIGGVAAGLVKAGNPGNMGFLRDEGFAATVTEDDDGFRIDAQRGA